MRTATPITIHGNDGVAFAPGNVHFLFSNGRFQYDCRKCGAHCCKGFGFDLHVGGELERCLKDSPALAPFVEPARGTRDRRLRVINSPPACFFLDSDNLCTIQREHGYSNKPETCRLFPFNVFRQCEDQLLVTPHVRLCPLQILEQGGRSTQSDHDYLYNEMARGGVEGPVKRVYPRTLDCNRLIQAEEAVVSRAARYLLGSDYAAFAGEQLSLAADLQHSDIGRLNWAARAAECRARLCGILGVSPDTHLALSASDVAVLVCVSPVLRSEMFFSPVVHVAHFSLERGVRVLIGLEVIASLARRAGMRAISYQTATHLFREFSELLELLSLVDVPVSVRSDARVTWPLGMSERAEQVYLSLIKTILSGPDRKRKTLGVVLLEHLEGSGLERILPRVRQR